MKKQAKREAQADPTEIVPSQVPEAAEAEKTEAEAPAEAAEQPPAELKEDALKKLQAECAALRERLVRRQADFENFRKRTEREVVEARHLAAAELTEALLPILDSFERALSVQGANSLDDYKTGIELIYKQFYDTLMRFGLTPVKAVGRPFDPHYHHAVERIETTEHKDQTVVEELQRGYTFKHKLVRPAMVKVAVHPSAGETPAAEAEPESAAPDSEEEQQEE